MTMATANNATQAAMPNYQLPDWELPDPSRRKTLKHVSKTNVRSTVSQVLNRVISSNRKCFGFSRRVFLVTLIFVFLAVVAIAVGLGVGLRKRAGYAFLMVIVHRP